jgi:hypothetical protein
LADPPTLVASTDGSTSIFHVPLTVGFQLSNADIGKVKRWHFLGGDPNPPSFSQDLVSAYTYYKNTYDTYPPTDNYYDVWVDVGHYDVKGNFVFEISSNHCKVPVCPQRNDLQYLDNNPSQWQGYIVKGDSVGFLVSEHVNSPVNWLWNDTNYDDIQIYPDEIGTYNLNPSHKYSDDGTYIVSLSAGPDIWYFPVLVIKSKQLAGQISVTGPHGTSLFQAGDTLAFSFTPPNNTAIIKPQPIFGSESEKYSWYFGNDQSIHFIDFPTYQQPFPKSGNFQVTVTVTNATGTTAWLVASTTVTVLDQPSITIQTSKNSLGAPVASVSGVGFPLGNIVRVTIDDWFSVSAMPDSSGNFTTAQFATEQLTNLPQHTAVAKSTGQYGIEASKSFTIQT